MVSMMKTLPFAWFMYAFLNAIGVVFYRWGIGETLSHFFYPYLISGARTLLSGAIIGMAYLLIVKTAPSRTVSVLGWLHLLCAAVSAVTGFWLGRFTYQNRWDRANGLDVEYVSSLYPSIVQFSTSVFGSIFFLIVIFTAYRDAKAPSTEAHNFD